MNGIDLLLQNDIRVNLKNFTIKANIQKTLGFTAQPTDFPGDKTIRVTLK